MKKLTQEEIQNMTLEDAWDITQKYADLIEEGPKEGTSILFEFEDVLPYSKLDILLALLKLLKEQDYEDVSQFKDFKEFVSSLIVRLDSFIPNEEQYKQILNTKKLLDDQFGQRVQKEDDESENKDKQDRFLRAFQEVVRGRNHRNNILNKYERQKKRENGRRLI